MVDDNKAAVSLGGVERRVNVNDDDSVEEDAAMASYKAYLAALMKR